MRELLRLPAGVRREIVAHARREWPNECCGLVLGTRREGTASSESHSGTAAHAAALTHEVQSVWPGRNLAASPTRFLLDPADHFAALRAVRGSALRIVGTYHSHPGAPARPSATDLAHANYPEYVSLIVSLSHGGSAELRAYRLTDGQAREVPVLPGPEAEGEPNL